MSPAAAVESVRSLSWLSWVLAAALGISTALAWPVLSDALWDAYDAARPVVSAQVTTVTRGADEAMVGLRVVKHRDCERLGIYAYSYQRDGMSRRLNIQRPNVVDLGYVPAGSTIVGEWRIWPTGDAISVSVHMTHQCAGRVVVTHLANVNLR